MVGLSPLVNAEHTHSTGDLSLTMTSMASGRFAPFSHAGPPRSLAKTSSFPRCYGVPFASPNASLQLKQTRRLVAAARHYHRAHPAWPSPTERPPRTHASCCGRICIFKKKINLSTSLAGQAVGIKEVDDGIWLVTFMDYDLGYIDLEEKTLQPLNNPFGPKV
jgi:hypothetical protein